MLKVLTFACFLSQVYIVVCSRLRPEIIFDPPTLDKIEENTIHRVNWTINKTDISDRVYFDFKYNVLHPMIFNVTSMMQDHTTACSAVGDEVYAFDVGGKFLGYGKLQMILNALDCWSGKPWGNYTTVYTYDISVVRRYTTAKDVFTAALGVAVTINYVNMGCQLDLAAIMDVLKSPVGPIIGLCCQFIIMPLGSFIFGWILLNDLSLRLGLFTLGCCPGGSWSNFWTLLLDGDLNLSITMTCISTIVALGMMPFWFFTLGSKLFAERATLPYDKLATSLVSLTGPLAIGILIRRFKPVWADLSEKIIRPFTVITMVVTVLLGIYANQYIFVLFTWQIVIAGLSIACAGYLLGSLVAWIFCLSRAQILTVGIETAFQNGGIAYIILVLSFPQPAADLTAVPIVAQLLLTGLPMWAGLCILRYLNKTTPERLSESEPENSIEDASTKEIEDRNIVLKH